MSKRDDLIQAVEAAGYVILAKRAFPQTWHLSKRCNYPGCGREIRAGELHVSTNTRSAFRSMHLGCAHREGWLGLARSIKALAQAGAIDIDAARQRAGLSPLSAS